MSTELVKAEIFRFLEDPHAEVLCIRGDWGVGKTFAWRQFLSEAEDANRLAFDNYAYVSLFGLNSLDSLRYTIFESTVAKGKFVAGPDTNTLRSLLQKSKNLGRKGRYIYDSFLTIVGKKDAGDALARAAFLLVRNQLICLDDLERAGTALEMRDVLGLTSFLKEQRNCKVVLLLNLDQMKDNEKDEFDRQLEKVVDVFLHFGPTPQEAAAIAIIKDQPVGISLREHTVELGIKNIRVIKKIERLALQLANILSEYHAGVVKQAIATVALSGWSHLQPGSAPPLDFIRNHNRIVASRHSELLDQDDKEKNWQRVLSNYPFISMDDFDRVIIDGVVAGYFNEAELHEEAAKLQSQMERNSRDNSFTAAWELFHHSLTVPDNEVLDALYKGAMANLGLISPLNLNGTVSFLREFDRNQQASQLVAAYIDAHKDDPRYFDRTRHIWSDSPLDDELAQAFERQFATFTDDRDPREVLLAIARTQGWNPEDEALIANQTAKDFERLFESIRGPELKSVIKMALTLGQRDNEQGRAINAAVSEALRRIGAKSPMSAHRVAHYGIKVDPDSPAASDQSDVPE